MSEGDGIVTYRKSKRDPQRDHTQNKKVQIQKDTGNLHADAKSFCLSFVLFFRE